MMHCVNRVKEGPLRLKCRFSLAVWIFKNAEVIASTDKYAAQKQI